MAIECILPNVNSMKFFERIRDKSKCWWCGSNELTGEHKVKKSDLELLYGKLYSKGNLVNHIKYKTESKGKNIQSSDSDRVKFEKNLCKNCNGARSQRFDLAYQKLIKFYYNNRDGIKQSKIVDLEQVFGVNWETEYLNLEKYIGKHVGCRMAECGLTPSNNLIAFLNGTESNMDLKISFQIKPYFFVEKDKFIDSIFVGPANPINNSMIKLKGFITSFCGWYTIANFTWNYLHEYNILNGNEINKNLKIDLVDYSSLEGIEFSLNPKLLMNDWSKILDKLEYFPYENGDRIIEHYRYIKNL